MDAAELEMYRIHVLNWSRDQLATSLEVDKQTLTAWEDAKVPVPDLLPMALAGLQTNPGNEHPRTLLRQQLIDEFHQEVETLTFRAGAEIAAGMGSLAYDLTENEFTFSPNVEAGKNVIPVWVGDVTGVPGPGVDLLPVVATWAEWQEEAEIQKEMVLEDEIGARIVGGDEIRQMLHRKNAASEIDRLIEEFQTHKESEND